MPIGEKEHMKTKTTLAFFLTLVLAACAGLPTPPTASTEDVATIQSGKTSREDVRKLLGAPIQMSTLPRLSREVWEYRLRHKGGTGELMFVWVQFSPDGMAREILQMPESQVMSTFSGQSQ
jgi:outer membrane protein assembly factor BamE (lipoprotein component of BamABCDE complex)